MPHIKFHMLLVCNKNDLECNFKVTRIVCWFTNGYYSNTDRISFKLKTYRMFYDGKPHWNISFITIQLNDRPFSSFQFAKFDIYNVAVSWKSVRTDLNMVSIRFWSNCDDELALEIPRRRKRAAEPNYTVHISINSCKLEYCASFLSFISLQ